MIVLHETVDSSNRRGWFIGPFMDGMKKTDKVEVKLERIPKGRVRKSGVQENGTTTLAFLIEGSIVFEFEEEDRSPYLLQSLGEYIIWSPNQKHRTTAWTDTVLMTIRWKE